MKHRLLPLLLSLSLLCPLLPAAHAQEEAPQPVTALCVSAPGGSAHLDTEELQLLCRRATGRDLESVTFSPLSPAVGTLTCKGEPVTSGAACYMYQNPQLSQVLFTPYTYASRRFTGQGEVSFTMTDEKGNTVPGRLLLYVPEETEPPVENRYMDKAAAFQAGEPIDLIDLLPDNVWYKSRSTGGATSWSSAGDGWYYLEEDLTSAVFALPPSDQGSLWLDYGWSTARKVLPGEVLYPDREPNFYGVTFVPAGGEEATVRLDYTAACEKRSEVPASLTLTLTAQTSTSQPSSNKPKPAPTEAAPAAVSTDAARVGLAAVLYQACAARQQGSLKTVTFDTLPSAEEGAILSADLPVTAGTSYPYSALAFLPGEAFQGGLTLRYVGTDSMGRTFPGTLTLSLDYPPEGRFRDLAGWEWAAYAVQFLDLQRAVPYARSAPLFRPGDPATRMELVYALVHAAYPTADPAAAPGLSGLPDDPALANTAAIAISRGLLQGDEEKRLLLDDQVKRQDALVLIHRALTDLGRDLPAPEALSGFSDADALSPYAREAAAVLLGAGILRGDGSRNLNPLSPITRAEMACLLYRAFGR